MPAGSGSWSWSGSLSDVSPAEDEASSATPALTSVAEDYLKTVWNAQEWSDQPLTVKELAQRLGLTAGTVSEGVRRLVQAGLIDHERYGRIELTPAGRSAALAVVRKHRLVETLLVRTFGYSWDEVHAEAEVLEHAISEEFLGRIDAHLGHPTRDPHGDPIPTADGVISIPDARQLSDLAAGECGVVTRVADADPELLQRLGGLGIVPGAHVVVREREDASALMQVVVANHGEHDGVASPFGIPSMRAVWVVGG